MGISPHDWADMTPAELNLYAQAYVDRKKEEQRLTHANIYNLATLIRTMVWSKHPPGFERVFPAGSQADKPPKAMTDNQMYAMVKSLNALFGGEVS